MGLLFSKQHAMVFVGNVSSLQFLIFARMGFPFLAGFAKVAPAALRVYVEHIAWKLCAMHNFEKSKEKIEDMCVCCLEVSNCFCWGCVVK